MKKLLSYMLFGEEGRYWNNIPYLLIANSFIYDDFHMKFFVHEACTESPFFPLLEGPAKKFSNIEIEVLNEPVDKMKLTIWRMKPLWESDADFLFCRDLDYAITDLERKSVEYFTEYSTKGFCGIRSYHLHTVMLMAGLCGFRVKDMCKKVKEYASSFEEYLQFGIKNVNYCKDWRWGCDQALLRDFFRPFLKDSFLDFPIQTAPQKIATVNVSLCVTSKYDKIKLSCNEKILDFSTSLSGFLGQPFICKTAQLQEMMSIATNETVEFYRRLFRDNMSVFGCFTLEG